MIKVSGENVAPTEVERVLGEHPDVADSAVVGEPHEFKDEVVAAFVVLREGATLDEDALRAHCADQLASFKVPQRLIAVEDLPRTSVGKTRKAPLRARLQDAPAGLRAAER
jgi:acyl-coenzyme A synthetase/AMP-(fatty) acid ligase